ASYCLVTPRRHRCGSVRAMIASIGGAVMLIHKVKDNSPPVEPLPDDLFNDEQIEMLAQIVADLRLEFGRRLQTLTDQVNAQAMEIAELRGQMTAMLALGASDKSLEISEVVRKLRLARE